MAWADALTLRKDEKVVDSWQGTREVLGSTFDVAVDPKEKKQVKTHECKEGLLVLTNQRLLFLEGQEPDGKKLGESVKLSLIDVDKVWYERKLDKVEEADGFETHVFSLKRVGKRKEFNQFKRLLEEHIKKRNELLEKETKKIIRFKLF